MSSTAEALERMRPWIERQRRVAYRPVVEERDSVVTASKFSGTPYLFPGEHWPVCPNCEEAMQLFLQLDLATLPSGLTFGSGLIQLFYCTNAEEQCDAELEGWEAFSRCHVQRLIEAVDRGDAGALGARGRAPPADAFPAKTIVGWAEITDLPHPEEHALLGLKYEYDFDRKTVRVVCPEIDVDIAGLPIAADIAEAIAQAEPGDKLGGWPHWVQGREYPACPRCRKEMTLVFQIDSENNVPFMFGDAGCGHLTQCPIHKDVLGFAWACS